MVGAAIRCGLPSASAKRVAHHRHVARGLHHRPCDQVGEAELLAGRLEVLAPRVEHVDGEGAEAGGGRDRATLVHEAHERGGWAADGRDLGAGCGGRRRIAIPFDRREDIFLDHAPARARALNRVEIDPLGAGDARGDRSCIARPVARGRGGAIGGRALVGALGRGLHGPAGCARARLDAAQDGSDRDRGIGLDQDLGDRARGRGGNLGVDLVGGDLYQRVVDRNSIANRNLPLEHRALGHGIAHLGEGDFHEFVGLSGRRPVAVDLDLTQHGPDRDGRVRFGQDLRERARGGGGQLGVDLVRGDLDERLLGVHLVTHRFQPPEDRSFGNRLAHLGHLYLHGGRARGHERQG